MTILLIDSYDSFTYNLKSLIEKATGAEVITIHNDSLKNHADLELYLPYFQAVIIGPGPGNPNNDADIGVLKYFFEHCHDVPTLGICLGFQAMSLYSGGQVLQLDTIQHGQVFEMEVIKPDPLFDGCTKFNSVRYHSLHVTLNGTDEIVPLAITMDNGDEVLMAGKHKTKPWYGVQYHPESICSDGGATLVKNFYKIACDSGRQLLPYDGCLSNVIDKTAIYDKSVQCQHEMSEETVPRDNLTGPVVCDLLYQNDVDFMLLNSASFPGVWSIIALPDHESTVFTHYKGSMKTTVGKWKGEVSETVHGDIWPVIGEFMQPKMTGASELPFIGGLVGFFSYEQGNYLHVDEKDTQPDTKLVYVKNTILINNDTNEMKFISLDSNFPAHIRDLVSKASEHTMEVGFPVDKVTITRPDGELYKRQFDECQDSLHKGDSYELCLCTLTKIDVPSEIKPWTIYKKLVSKNPSPYSSFIAFDDSIILSTSPERFISWNDKMCQLRPIKGTVKKPVEYSVAEEILKSPKEQGENLMIVDLIRHDLFELLPDVEVTKLMSIEEYKTVYQLVSVIEGHNMDKSPYSGLDLLKHSLPAGSMTGAPKKKSVEILQQIEPEKRGIYSGVTGYLSVNQNSDWSVNIRCVYKYGEEDPYWKIGAGGAITVLSTAQGEWEELQTKLDSALQTFTS